MAVTAILTANCSVIAVGIGSCEWSHHPDVLSVIVAMDKDEMATVIGVTLFPGAVWQVAHVQANQADALTDPVFLRSNTSDSMPYIEVAARFYCVSRVPRVSTSRAP